MNLHQEAAAAVTELVGGHPVEVVRLSGGDAGAVFEVELDDGDLVVAKTHTGHAPGAVRAEAASLAWLAESGAVPVPEVRAHDDRWLVLDHVEPGSPSPAAAEQLGRGLAALHASGAPAFGAPPPSGPVDAWIGLAPMRNETAATWPEFYARHRVEPYLRRAVDQGVLTTAESMVIARVLDVVDEVAGPAEPPARLHGDLWSGNVHWGADGLAWLIDPAAHGGHRETDLAMLQLFGCPHLDRVLGAYQEVHPLAEGWADRVPLHQLFPLLVHVVLFGRAYAAQAVAAARRTLALR
ncbi:MAG TPA: fructosamine kinase family protein [Pseudonocardiaceae bacterium]